jgi:hypothetical protein
MCIRSLLIYGFFLYVTCLYLKLHHKSNWQIVGQVTSQAPVFWRLKEGEEGVVRVCSEASAVVRAVAA